SPGTTAISRGGFCAAIPGGRTTAGRLDAAATGSGLRPLPAAAGPLSIGPGGHGKPIGAAHDGGEPVGAEATVATACPQTGTGRNPHGSTVAYPRLWSGRGFTSHRSRTIVGCGGRCGGLHRGLQALGAAHPG